MKKLIIALMVANLMILITGCANSCKIEGCKNEIYKEGLCEEHYTAIKKADKQAMISEESTEESKMEETTIQQEDQKISRPFSGKAESEISEGISPDDYILPECDMRKYTLDELSILSDAELRLARNEIYARHGRMFTADDLKSYFSLKTWYTPIYSASEFDAMGDSMLNEFEIANRNLIGSLEKKKGNVGGAADITTIDKPTIPYWDIMNHLDTITIIAENDSTRTSKIIDKGNYYVITNLFLGQMRQGEYNEKEVEDPGFDDTYYGDVYFSHDARIKYYYDEGEGIAVSLSLEDYSNAYKENWWGYSSGEYCRLKDIAVDKNGYIVSATDYTGG